MRQYSQRWPARWAATSPQSIHKLERPYLYFIRGVIDGPIHFRLNMERIESISGVGSVTARVLRLNAAERLAERRVLQSLGIYP